MKYEPLFIAGFFLLGFSVTWIYQSTTNRPKPQESITIHGAGTTTTSEPRKMDEGMHEILIFGKKTEDGLALSEMRFALVNASGTMLFYFDDKDQFHDCGHSAEEIARACMDYITKRSKATK